MELLCFNVNEEGEVYGAFEEYHHALFWLEEFPNDSIVVAVKGSPMADKLFSEYRQYQRRLPRAD